MRKIILFMVMSLDGFVSGPNGELDWENQDAEIGKALLPTSFLKTVDTLLIGRVLYEGFAQYWPQAAKDPNNPKELVTFANWIVEVPKVVFSKTLKKVSWENSSLVSVKDDAEMVKEITKLKKQKGKDIIFFGGVRFAQTMVRLNLVDEYRFKLQPVILGSGKPLFKDIKDRHKLKLTRATSFNSGVVGLYYQPINK